MDAAPDPHQPRALLIGNYAPDRQESMQRFAQVLGQQLLAHGVSAELVQPEARVGRFAPRPDGIGKWLGYVDKFVLFPKTLRRRLATMNRGSARPIVHICDHSNAMYVHSLQGQPHLVTCNDLLAVRSAQGEFPQNRTRWSGRVLQRLIARGLRRARRITCISHATAADVRRLLPDAVAQVSVTPMGLNYPYSPLPRETAAAQVAHWLGLPVAPPFILHVGGGQWYKNRDGVVRIYTALHRRLAVAGQSTPHLVMVGPALPPETSAHLHEHAGLAERVHVRSGVDNELLRACYSAAELLLFPSLEEGFGWPIIEAQACGCRVVTTGKPPMDEVGGLGPAYLPAEAVRDSADDACAAGVESLLMESDGARAERISQGFANARRFSMETMVSAYAAIYRELAAA